MKWALGRAGVLTATAIVLNGCGSAPPRVEPPPPKVSVQQPQTRQITDYDDYNGWVDSPEIVEIRARVRGHIMQIHFTDGDIVKKDQVLFDLDPRPFQQDIDRANEQVNIFQAQLNVALVEEKRVKELETGAASGIEIESSFAKARSLEAQVQAQKEEVARKKLELAYSHVQAPIAGRIGRAMLDVGNLVNAGGTDPLLATIVTVDPVQVYFSVDERALQRYQKIMGPTTTQSGVLRDRKMPFQFGLETDEGYPNAGVLDFADNRVDATTGTILVRGAVANPQGRYVPGSRVRVRVPIGDERPSVLIPDTAILSDQDRKYVLVVDDKNVVQRRDVLLGKLLDDGMRIILQGTGSTPTIGPSDTIITMGLQAARINYPVEPVKPTTQPAAVAAR